ncbi:hypothetical protein P5F24_14910 [Clostridium perfringens]|nr:hypothetical protein [Clostridium perfringens]
MGVVFGAVEPKGKLPVDIPNLNNDGTMNTEVNYYDYVHGITNINSLGNINISFQGEKLEFIKGKLEFS